VGFEPTIPAFERAETVHALDRVATVVGMHILLSGANSLTGNKLKMTLDCVNINIAISYVNFI
jgi:hypothetical protein